MEPGSPPQDPPHGHEEPLQVRPPRLEIVLGAQLEADLEDLVLDLRRQDDLADERVHLADVSVR
jgi:hypothetical protein